MESKFSIGEMGKIHNISVQTLRHYDKMGLLKPSFINEKTGYRYYGTKDFVTIDLIKQCKSMGLSLEEIKDIIDNYTSCESILSVIERQKDIIDKKIKELNGIKENISFMERGIKQSLEEGLNNIFVKEYEDRKFLKYNNTNRFTEEFEITLSKTLVHMEKHYSSFNKELAFTTSYKALEEREEIEYLNMMINFTRGIPYEGKEIVTLEKGKYLTINFDDDYRKVEKYYRMMMEYIRKNEIKTLGDFYEIYIITRVSKDGVELALGKLQIRIE